jgi:hypothetical protein
MLKELYLEFEDGRTETKLIHLEPGEQVKISPQQDGIVTAGCKTFKYQVPKHGYLTKSIFRFGDKTFIYPAQIECHPKTTLDDIVEYLTEEQLLKEKIEAPKVEIQKWEFESASGGGTYTVTLNKFGNPKCNCSGFWRVKDKEKGCKHVQEVRKNMGSM